MGGARYAFEITLAVREGPRSSSTSRSARSRRSRTTSPTRRRPSRAGRSSCTRPRGRGRTAGRSTGSRRWRSCSRARRSATSPRWPSRCSAASASRSSTTSSSTSGGPSSSRSRGGTTATSKSSSPHATLDEPTPLRSALTPLGPLYREVPQRPSWSVRGLARGARGRPWRPCRGGSRRRCRRSRGRSRRPSGRSAPSSTRRRDATIARTSASQPGIEEERARDAVATARAAHPVRRRPVPTAGHPLEHVAEVAHERVAAAAGSSIHPSRASGARVRRPSSWHEDREQAVVRVLADAPTRIATHVVGERRVVEHPEQDRPGRRSAHGRTSPRRARARARSRPSAGARAS